jgi:hypothetical protein
VFSRVREEPQVPPLRYAPVGMTILLRELTSAPKMTIHTRGSTFPQDDNPFQGTYLFPNVNCHPVGGSAQ